MSVETPLRRGRGRPERQRATYNRRHGIRYLVGALDVHADYLRIRPRPRRNGVSTLTFMRQIRLAYPRQIRLYWIRDGLSSHSIAPKVASIRLR